MFAVGSEVSVLSSSIAISSSPSQQMFSSVYKYFLIKGKNYFNIFTPVISLLSLPVKCKLFALIVSPVFLGNFQTTEQYWICRGQVPGKSLQLHQAGATCVFSSSAYSAQGGGNFIAHIVYLNANCVERCLCLSVISKDGEEIKHKNWLRQS